MTSRTFVPCRECGKEHRNPRSSSLCPSCGVAAASAHRVERARREDQEREARVRRRDEFYAINSVHEMKEWMLKYTPEVVG